MRNPFATVGNETSLDVSLPPLTGELQEKIYSERFAVDWRNVLFVTLSLCRFIKKLLEHLSSCGDEVQNAICFLCWENMDMTKVVFKITRYNVRRQTSLAWL